MVHIVDQGTTYGGNESTCYTQENQHAATLNNSKASSDTRSTSDSKSGRREFICCSHRGLYMFRGNPVGKVVPVMLLEILGQALLPRLPSMARFLPCLSMSPRYSVTSSTRQTQSFTRKTVTVMPPTSFALSSSDDMPSTDKYSNIWRKYFQVSKSDTLPSLLLLALIVMTSSTTLLRLSYFCQTRMDKFICVGDNKLTCCRRALDPTALLLLDS